jgi:hypothetical protein
MNAGWARVAGVGLAATWLVSTGCELGTVFDDFGVPVAWVDDEPVVREDLHTGGSLEAPDARREAVERGIEDLLAAREARRRGLGFTEDAVRRIAAVRRAAEVRERRVLREALFEVVAAEIEIGEDQLRADFDARHATTRRRSVTLRTQQFPTRDAAEQRDAALGDLGRLAPVRSTPWGPLLVRKLPPALRDATRGLQERGERAVADVDGVWTIVELVDEQRGEALSFEDARDAIERNLRRRLAEDRFARELQRLRDRADVRFDPAALANDALWER